MPAVKEVSIEWLVPWKWRLTKFTRYILPENILLLRKITSFIYQH